MAKESINKCPFCVSRMHASPYENHWDEIAMIKRIKYAVMNGVNTCILTGTGEALQNREFLIKLARVFKEMDYPFPNVELQTTGVLLENHSNIELLKNLGVNTISLSVASIFSDALNLTTIGVSEKIGFRLASLIRDLKEQGFNIRLSLNMLKDYDDYHPKQIIDQCKDLGTNQVTFRKMYIDQNIKSPQSEWVIKNACLQTTLWRINQYVEGGKDFIEPKIAVRGHGEFLYKLPFGGKVYSIEGMSTVMDDDCMSKESNDSLKYIVLREDGKLYCRWDDKGSLIF